MSMLDIFISNRYSRTCAVVGTIVLLTACNSNKRSNDNDNDNEVEPTTKQVTVRLIPNIATNDIGPALLDAKGYEHFIETEEYQLVVDGEVVESGINLDFDTPKVITLEVENRDAVEIAIEHPRFVQDKDAGATLTSTLDGSALLYKESTQADIVLDNNEYSFVTVDINQMLYINEARLNDVIMQRVDTDQQAFSYKYAYAPVENSVLAVESDLGIQLATFTSSRAKQYKFVLDENNNDLILDDDEDEIDLGGKVSINPNRIMNAVDLVVTNTGAVSGTSTGVQGKAVHVVYPMRTLSGDLREVYPLNRYNIDIDIAVDDSSADTFVNIYLIKDGTKCRGDYHLAGAHAGKVFVSNCDNNGYQQFNSYDEFLSAYGNWGVRNDYFELNYGFANKINFVYRLGDSTYQNITDFAVHEYEIAVAPSVIDYSQILRAKDITTGRNGSVTGLTNNKAPWIYVPLNESIKLSSYDLSVEIEFDDAPHFINIYLKDESGKNVTANYFLSGTNTGMVHIEGDVLTISEFMSSDKYGQYLVRGDYIERDGFNFYRGNFFWRGGDSSYRGENAPFTVHQYKVN
ncbi:hypothetical protein [Vibrio sonorensis]|uniref:hypothetical protein n=1 Tax=Vibrio sonorensis TaxID=1004316 RepID=UPI0008D9BCBB|nr:hypothetical protein [Vibrio sonorensis]